MTPSYNLYLKSLTFPKKAPLPLNQLKNFLSIDVNYHNQDDLLEDLLNMATEYAEWYTEKSFMRQEWKIVCIGQIPNRIYLPYGPIISVEKIILEDGTALSTNSYVVEIIGSYVQFFFLGYYGKIEIIYTSGHDDTGKIPAFVREGILWHVSYAYHNRNDIHLMSNVRKLYDQFREVRLTL